MAHAAEFHAAKRLGRALMAGTGLGALLAAGALHAQEMPSFNLYGMPGMIDMPSAEAAPDGTLALSYGKLGDSNRGTLIFQITPKLTGAFRYTGIQDYQALGAVDGVYYDRSFDLRYQLWDETDLRPAVAVGLQDFIGTGVYSGEYVVATKTLGGNFKVTAGLGWGRLGTYNSVATFGSRPPILGANNIFTGANETGGTPTYDRWFRGDVAPFGGISWSPTDRLTFKLEYSSDDYRVESTNATFDHAAPVNLGVDYTLKNGTQVSAYYAYGSEVGLQLTYPFNPKTLGMPGGVEDAGVPVKPREPSDVNDLGWTANLPQRQQSARERLATSLQREDLEIEGFRLEPRRATIRLRNPLYGAPSQAIGRAARVMTRTLPASVEEFVIVPVENGMPMSAVVLQRSDLEAHENDAAVEMLARTRITDAFGQAPEMDLTEYPKFIWALEPYYAYSTFDPQSPLRMDFGARLTGDYFLTPNVILTGKIKKRVIGNLDQIDREDESKLPRVRTDYGAYNREGDPAIEQLTIAHFGRPGRNLYSRFTFGILEQMYAGASAELLWKPVASRLALGVEVNYVRRREFDQMLGIQENVTVDPVSGAELTFPEVNGHVSAYYDFGNGFHGQLDVGRYLAGDYGATITVHREFANGWKVGAFATFTDVSEEEFGEGSFDKGILITIPLSVGLGTPSRTTSTVALRSVQRDGGARVFVPDRLYEKVRTWHEPDVVDSWGRFWR
ncbi:YjbH domain-containing protein [Salipiger mucosus]|uniref:Putative outer membrane lipoprotein n=1 Tax=Salipiger mucosus DSM 16094 TaxID=1123237 RepID=S9QMH7_9RHOB|nr:YjbH domain-containing protein [Salipiger mucosus]EPX82636.1 Putative outer membrane lipoprotein [Salipiger mucosus DSM 16094]